ncbi:MAG: MFS transporter [Gammaproteobacteria bacterium]|nr:MFS transporter [Gammaproteobacteria bacterium]
MVIKDKAILLIALSQTTVWAGLYYLFPALLLTWEEDFGWGKSDLTIAITGAVLMSAIVSPAAGKLIDAGKGPFTMYASATLGGIGLLGVASVQELWQFYLAWGFIGVMLGGCLYDPCFSLITRSRGGNAKNAIVSVTLIAGFASSISFPAVHFLTDVFGWRIAVQVFGGVVVFIGAPLAWRGASLIEGEGLREVVRVVDAVVPRHFLLHPAFWLLAIGFSLAGMLHGMTLHHLLPILSDRNIDPGMAIVVASLIGPMQVLGRLIIMKSERIISVHGLALSCFITMAGAIVLLFIAPSLPISLFGFVFLFGVGYGTVSIIRPLTVRIILGQGNFGAKSGFASMIYLVGAAIAPYIGAVLWSTGGYDLVLYVAVFLALSGLLFYSIARKVARKNWPEK